MKIGGAKTRYLFADMIKAKTLVEVAGVRQVQAKNGKDIPFCVLLGAIEGDTCEYLCSVFRIESAKPFDPEKPAQFYIERKGDNIFFTPV